MQLKKPAKFRIWLSADSAVIIEADGWDINGDAKSARHVFYKNSAVVAIFGPGILGWERMEEAHEQ